MSVMSDVFGTITDGLEQGVPVNEIAYALTCDYPSMTISTAMEMISDVIRFEDEYLGEVE